MCGVFMYTHIYTCIERERDRKIYTPFVPFSALLAFGSLGVCGVCVRKDIFIDIYRERERERDIHTLSSLLCPIGIR